MSGRASVTLFLVLVPLLFVAITGLDWEDYLVVHGGRAALSPREHLGYAVFTSAFVAALATIGARWLAAGWIGCRQGLARFAIRLRPKPRATAAAGLALAVLAGLGAPPVPAARAQVEPPPEEGERRHQLTLTLLPDGGSAGRRLLVVARPWFYCHAHTGEVLRVPPGYVTDLASVPRVVQPFVPPFGSYAEASVLHDWLYAVRHPGGRKRADLVMLYAMRDFRSERARTGPYQAWVIYKAVRLFGWRGYYFRAERAWPAPGKLALAWRGRSESGCVRFQDELDSGIYARQFARRLAALEKAAAG